MKLDKGQPALHSVMGTLFSFIAFCLVMGYTIQKFDILISRKDVDIVYSLREEYFSDDEVFTGRQGLNVAVALSGFDTEQENILTPEIGSFSFQYSKWYFNDNGVLEYETHELETHRCSDEELGLTGSHSEFKPIRESNRAYVSLYRRKFVCVNRHDLEIYGDFDSKKAQQLRILLNRCIGHDYCKSVDEINAYLKGKYVLLLKNEIRFDSTRYSEESIISESRLDWLRVITKQQQNLTYQIQKTRLQLQDLMIDLDQITELEDSSVFSMEKQPIEFVDKGPELVLMFSIQMQMDQVNIGRVGYNVIDMLSDIGGIQSIILTTFALVLSILNHNYFDNYMAQRLYKMQGLQPAPANSQDDKNSQ